MELKSKLFIRYAPFRWPIPLETTKVQYVITDKLNRTGISLSDKKLIKKYIENLSTGINIYPPESGPNPEDTEYLSQISLKISNDRGYLVYSKKLSGDDRFCYKIYAPVKHPIDENTSIIRIEIYSCKGHTRPDGGSYWDTDPEIKRKIKNEIRQWRQRNGLPPMTEI